MSLILDGTNGLSDVDGTAGTPAIRGSDANTGIFFGTDIIGFSEGGAECARFNADAQFVAAAGTASLPVLTTTGDLNTGIFFPAADTIAFAEGGAEAMRIDSSGNLLVGTTSLDPGIGNTNTGAQVSSGAFIASRTSGTSLFLNRNTSDGAIAEFRRQGNQVGSISVTTSATAYNTSSDYRLKHDIQPMTGALAKVALLKPVTYKWNADNSADEGFIAHELQEVCPSAVSGEKDAVDAEGNPQYQGIDTSFLTATLAAALQELHQIVKDQAAEIAELKAINDAQAQTIESLTARVVALEGQA